MRVKLDRSRDGYREYSERNYDDRFKRRNYRNDNHSYHSSRASVKSRLHHHHHKDYSSNRNQSNYYTDHSVTTSRFDRQNTYSEEPPDQPILSGDPPYYNSLESARDRGSYYTESERNRYVPSAYRRESSPPPTYRPSTSLSTHNSYNDVHRTSDYPIRSERYDIPQNRNCSITNLSSPVYRSDSYQTSSSASSSYIPHEQYPPMDYHYHSSNSYRDRSRLNFNENGSKRSIRR